MSDVKVDFGEKIGGARKDLWGARGLEVSDLGGMNAAEKKKFVKKDNIWKKPDYLELRKNGMDREVVYFRKIVRDAIRPQYNLIDTPEEYVESVKRIQNFVESFDTLDDGLKKIENVKDVISIHDFVTTGLDKTILSRGYTYQRKRAALEKKMFAFTDEERMDVRFRFVKQKDVSLEGGYLKVRDSNVLYERYLFYPNKENIDPSTLDPDKYCVIDRTTFVETDVNENDLQTKKEALYKAAIEEEETTNTKNTKKGKKRYVESVLENVAMSGVNYRNGLDVTGDDILNQFNIRGGEFGNWLNEKDAQLSLNHVYDSFMNIAAALEIDPKDVSLGGRLAIAFGARGHSNALAHYEPEREVINLTKMKGAGSLAHEWIHAQDNIFCKERHLGDGFLSEKGERSLPISMITLLNSMMDKEITGKEAAEYRKAEMEAEEKKLLKGLDDVCWAKELTEDEQTELKAIKQDIVKELKDGDPYVFAEFNFHTSKWKYDTSLSPAVERLNDFQLKKGKEGVLRNSKFINSTRQLYSEKVQKYRDALENDVTIRIPTQFYKDAKTLDNEYSKSKNGYWSSNVEMLARAGASYIRDKLQEHGIKDPYLVGHSEGNSNNVSISPQGEERKTINQAFDAYFNQMKQDGLLHHMDFDQVMDMKIEKPILNDFNVDPYEETKQLTIDDIFNIWGDDNNIDY